MCSGRRLVRLDHVDPHRVAADRRALDAAQHAAERAASRAMSRRCARRSRNGRCGWSGRLVDAHEPGILGIAAGDRMVLELAEVPRERDVLGARDVLVAEEQHAVLEQQRADLGRRARRRARRRRGSTLDSSAPIVQVSGSTLDRAARRRWLPGQRSALRWRVMSFLLSVAVPQIAKIDEPIVLRDSRSRCACAASCSR